MAEWYYSTTSGQQSGPVDDAQLRALAAGGQLQADHLVWREGMPQWARAADAGLIVARPVAALRVQSLQQEAPELATASAIATAAFHQAPVQLSYAAPVIAGVPVIGHDEGPFLKVGRQFTLPGGRWVGVCVASPQAFYLLKLTRRASGLAYGLGGLAGAMLQTAFSTADDVRTCDLNDLPHPVRLALDKKGRRKGGDVIVLPRDAIRLVKLGTINNKLAAHIGAERFAITTGLFSNGKIRRFLAGGGWMLNQELIPTVAPIHGHGYGREFHEIGKNGPGTAKRVTYAIIGITIIVLVIVLRILGAMR